MTENWADGQANAFPPNKQPEQSSPCFSRVADFNLTAEGHDRCADQSGLTDNITKCAAPQKEEQEVDLASSKFIR